MFQENMLICLRSDLWFLIEYGIFLSLKIFRSSFLYITAIELPFDVIYYSCGGLIVLHLFFLHIYGDRKSIIKLLLFCILIAAIGFFCDNKFYDNELIYIAVFFYLGKDVDIYKTIRLTIWIMIIGLFVTFVFSRIGIIDTAILDNTERYRDSVGFHWYLYPSEYAFNITALYIYLKKTSIRWIAFPILVIINTYYYIETNSRLSFVLSLVILAFAVAMKLWPRFPEKLKALHYLAVGVFPICGLTIMTLSYFYSDAIPWLVDLNVKMEWRLSSVKNAFDNIGITLIGNKTGNYLDIAYAHVFFWWGLVIAIVLLVIHIIAMYQVVKIKDYYLEFILCIIAVHAMIDDLVCMLCFNTFWFLVLLLVFNKDQLKFEIKKS